MSLFLAYVLLIETDERPSFHKDDLMSYLKATYLQLVTKIGPQVKNSAVVENLNKFKKSELILLAWIAFIFFLLLAELPA